LKKGLFNNTFYIEEHIYKTFEEAEKYMDEKAEQFDGSFFHKWDNGDYYLYFYLDIEDMEEEHSPYIAKQLLDDKHDEDILRRFTIIYAHQTMEEIRKDVEGYGYLFTNYHTGPRLGGMDVHNAGYWSALNMFDSAYQAQLEYFYEDNNDEELTNAQHEHIMDEIKEYIFDEYFEHAFEDGPILKHIDRILNFEIDNDDIYEDRIHLDKHTIMNLLNAHITEYVGGYLKAVAEKL
jgi:hypothetical protein